MPSTVLPADIAKELGNLADALCKLTNSVFVLGVPHRGSYRKRASAVNSEIQRLAETKLWKYRGLCDKVYNDYHTGTDSIHLRQEGRRAIQ